MHLDGCDVVACDINTSSNAPKDDHCRIFGRTCCRWKSMDLVIIKLMLPLYDWLLWWFDTVGFTLLKIPQLKQRLIHTAVKRFMISYLFTHQQMLQLMILTQIVAYRWLHQCICVGPAAQGVSRSSVRLAIEVCIWCCPLLSYLQLPLCFVFEGCRADCDWAPLLCKKWRWWPLQRQFDDAHSSTSTLSVQRVATPGNAACCHWYVCKMDTPWLENGFMQK